MADYLIDGTGKTPRVHLCADAGVLEISGRSIPENALEFYKPVLEWLDAYSLAPQPHTRMDLRLEYLNTSSSKCLFDLFRKLERIAGAGHDVGINWYHDPDDEEMMETGEDFRDVVKIPISVVASQEREQDMAR